MNVDDLKIVEVRAPLVVAARAATADEGRHLSQTALPANPALTAERGREQVEGGAVGVNCVTWYWQGTGGGVVTERRGPSDLGQPWRAPPRLPSVRLDPSFPSDPLAPRFLPLLSVLSRVRVLLRSTPPPTLVRRLASRAWPRRDDPCLYFNNK